MGTKIINATKQSPHKEETKLEKWEIIRLRVDMIDVHKIMKVMGKMNIKPLFPKSCNV